MSTAAAYFRRRLFVLHGDELSRRSCKHYFSAHTAAATASNNNNNSSSIPPFQSTWPWLIPQPQPQEKRCHHRIPSLMLYSPVLPETRYLYNLNDSSSSSSSSSSNEMSFSRELHLPQIVGHNVMGSSQGYIMSVDPTTADLRATDPLTGSQLPLPPTSAFPGFAGIIRRPSDRTILHYVSAYDTPLDTPLPVATHTCYLQKDTTRRLVKGEGNYYYNYYSNNHRALIRRLVFLNPEQYFTPILKMRFHHYRKAILSPSLDTLVVIHGSSTDKPLAFAPTSSSSSWTYLTPYSFPRTTLNAKFCDIIFHDGRLHALDQTGALVVFNLSSSSNGDVMVEPDSIKLPNGRRYPRDSKFKSFLVESPHGNDLFYLVADNSYRSTVHPCFTTLRFNVFKLDKSNCEWNQVESIGDLALFVGLNQSLALSARDFPNLVKPNHIYFTQCCHDRYPWVNPEPWDNIHRRGTGVFSLKDGTIHPFTNHSCPILDHWQSPIWFTPATR